MWRRSAWLVVWSLALHGPYDLLADEPAQRSNLLAHQKAVQFDLVLGRVSATNVRVTAARCQTTEKVSGDLRELLTISAQRLTPTIHYAATDANGSVVVDVVNGNEVTIRAERTDATGTTTKVRFEQPAQGGVSLEISQGGSAANAAPIAPPASQPRARGENRHRTATQKYAAPSLWHLSLAEREICEAELLPLLSLLRSHWQPAEQIRAVEDALFEVAERGTLPDRGRVAELVVQLASKEFRRRQAGDRQLRELGPGVVPYLEVAARGTLDEEQRVRVQAILQSFAAAASDTPERVAAWLATDPAIWLLLLSNVEPERRQLAAEHLSKLVSFPLDFDPLADTATRVTQVAALRKQCGIR